jgi:ankyrin repeat protein
MVEGAGGPEADHDEKEEAIAAAAHAGNHLTVSSLISHFPRLVRSRWGHQRDTPLMLACLSGSEATVQKLLESGADVRAANEMGDQPVHYACSEGHRHVLAMLLDRGADPSTRSNRGTTPLQAAAFYGTCGGEWSAR